MNPSDFYSDQLNSWHKTKHDFEPFIWPIEKKICFWKILKFFSIKYLHLGSCLNSSRDISILVPKTATRAMDAFSNFRQILSKLEITSNIRQNGTFYHILHRYHVHSIVIWVFVSILETSPMSCYSIFAENILNESIALVAVFGTNIEMFLDESKQLPKWIPYARE